MFLQILRKTALRWSLFIFRENLRGEEMKRILLLFLAVSMLLMTGCASKQSTPATKKVQVAVSIYPLAEFVRAVGGEKVQVNTLVPAGVEAHSYELSATDMKTITQAQVFVYNGGGMESWADKVEQSLKDKPVKILQAGKGLFVKLDEEHQHGEHKDEHKHEEHKHEAGHVHDHGGFDPHVWLDPVLASKQVAAISETLQAADPTNKEYYQKNAAAYQAELNKLDQEFKAMRAQAKQDAFVTTHSAFGSMAKRYDLHQIAIMGITPNVEPTPQALANLINLVKKEQIKYIFFEELVSPKVAQTIAAEAGVKTLVLNPVEGLTKTQQEKKVTYLELMRQNIANLKIALENK